MTVFNIQTDLNVPSSVSGRKRPFSITCGTVSIFIKSSESESYKNLRDDRLSMPDK